MTPIWMSRTDFASTLAKFFNVPQSAIAIGVPAYTNPEDNTIQKVLLMPFCQQRDDWCNSDLVTTKRDPAIVGDDPTRIVDIDPTTVLFSDRQKSYS